VKHKNLSYEKKLSKRNGQMRWLIIERPTGSIISKKVFEDEADEIVKFQNQYQVWAPRGFPRYMTLGKI
jgi:hypothetical protein